MNKGFNAKAKGSGIALEIHRLVRKAGQVEILRGVDLSVSQGERHALIGPNGAGKSTLFNVVSGLDAATSGRIYLHGGEITGLAPHRISRLGLSRSFQASNVFSNLSVFDNLRCATLRPSGQGYAWWRRLSGLASINDLAHTMLGKIGLAERASTLAGALTYAEQRALELGMALATEAKVLLLDEPTAGMNRAEAARMVELIRSVCMGKTLLVVEHDMSVVFELADRVSVMVYGAIIATDTPQRIRENEAVQQAYLGQIERGPDR